MSDLVLMEQQQGLAELIGRAHARFLDCKDLTIEEAERIGTVLATLQRDVMFQVGDLARYAEARWPDTHHQVWPAWVSPGLLARTAGVCRAYPNESDRGHEATYSQYMQAAGKPDRQKLLVEMVGQTTDESRKAGRDAPSGHGGPHGGTRWLLAVDVNYFLHRFWHSGAGVEAATGVASWVQRTVSRLKEKGLTDVACCFDSHENHRKALTKEWEDRYKDRPPKDPELVNQLVLVRELLHKANFACVQVEDMEADDVMASYAKQFDGKVTLLTQDKDCRQCLSSKCNILLDVTWKEDDTSGEHLPDYKWLTAQSHTEATGIPPERWTELQMLQGDSTDNIKGAAGIGATGAKNLIVAFGSADAAIQAAKDNDERLLSMTRGKIMAKGLLDFETKAEVTRKLVTLRDDLTVPNSTRIV